MGSFFYFREIYKLFYERMRDSTDSGGDADYMVVNLI